MPPSIKFITKNVDFVSDSLSVQRPSLNNYTYRLCWLLELQDSVPYLKSGITIVDWKFDNLYI